MTKRPETRIVLFVGLLLTSALTAAMLGCGSETATARNGSSPSPDSATAESPGASKRNIPQTKALERAGDRSYDKTFDDVRFDMEPDESFRREMIPEEIHAMDGERIRIRGYILPTAQKRGLREFVLVRDNQECCFGPGAALYDCILVHMEPGKTTEFSMFPVAVAGRFTIQVFPDDEQPLSIYHLEAETVE